MIGTTLHHYRIIGRLGAGGMGEVYAAEDVKLQRRVALKVLPPGMAHDPDRLQRFQREARAVAALNHPNVVTVYSVEEAEGVQFLTMELVEGKTLDQVIPKGGLPFDVLLKLAVPLADAVAFAHQHGIIHRDLKPANIMLADDGRLKVLDFGLAKLKPQISSTETTLATLATQSLTQQNSIVGTAAYMSPEQAEGRPVDHRSDIFSLGVVLYEMACGRRPFNGDTVFSLISSIIRDTPPPLSATNREIPPSLDRIVRTALAKDPERRFQSALDLRNELQALQQQTAAGRMAVNILGAFARSRWTRRVALAAVVVAVVVAAAFAVLSWRGTRSDSPSTPPPSLRANFRRLTAQPGVEQFPSLLTDRKWVVYSGQGLRNRHIYLLSTTGQNPIDLTADSTADDDEPAASPDGEHIAFRSSREGGGIFVMGRTGEGVRRVSRAGNAFNPAWSPDGTEIAFTTEDVQLTPLNWERRSELWVVNVNTGAERQLQTDDAVQAAWSPHGQRIAYVARLQQANALKDGAAVGRTMDIWTVPARGGKATAVLADRPTDWGPAWSPDGRYLYFVSDRGGSMNLWRVAVDEASGKRLGEPEAITTPAPFLAHPGVSSDGRQIAYGAVVQSSNIQRMTLDPVNGIVKGEPAWVTTGSRLWANPDPTPDGDWVVFYSRDQPEGDVYVSRPDGTSLRQLTSDAAVDRVPRWSPDKTWVAFFSNRGGPLQVWKIRADGSGLQAVTRTGGVPVWSPDGHRLATSEVLDFAGGAWVVDANRPVEEQSPQRLPRPDPAIHPFIPNAWSPDGTKLAGQIGFSSGAGKGVVIYTFASRTYERLTDFGEWPVWLGDGRRVLFVARGREFWILDTRTKQARKVYSTVWDVLGPPQVTRDGRTVYFSRRVTESDIYLLTFESSGAR